MTVTKAKALSGVGTVDDLTLLPVKFDLFLVPRRFTNTTTTIALLTIPHSTSLPLRHG